MTIKLSKTMLAALALAGCQGQANPVRDTRASEPEAPVIEQCPYILPYAMDEFLPYFSCFVPGPDPDLMSGYAHGAGRDEVTAELGSCQHPLMPADDGTCQDGLFLREDEPGSPLTIPPLTDADSELDAMDLAARVISDQTNAVIAAGGFPGAVPSPSNPCSGPATVDSLPGVLTHLSPTFGVDPHGEPYDALQTCTRMHPFLGLPVETHLIGEDGYASRMTYRLIDSHANTIDLEYPPFVRVHLELRCDPEGPTICQTTTFAYDGVTYSPLSSLDAARAGDGCGPAFERPRANLAYGTGAVLAPVDLDVGVATAHAILVPRCRYTEPLPEPIVELCDNDLDDDSDGLIDCGDDGCALADVCLEAEDCANGWDDDDDVLADCADPDCHFAAGCSGIEDCGNGDDDDGDGDTDCDDAECRAYGGCAEDCDNGVDDDADGAVDRADGDCAERCADGIDNDADGNTDCGDPACASSSPCLTPEDGCDDGEDDNGNGVIDCDDPSCALVSPCYTPPPTDDGEEGGDGIDAPTGAPDAAPDAAVDAAPGAPDAAPDAAMDAAPGAPDASPGVPDASPDVSVDASLFTDVW